MKHGKRYRAAREQVAAGRTYDLDEAIALAKKNATAKFDEALELHLRLGIDPKKGEQQVRGTVKLPHSVGTKIRIAVFTGPDNEAAAKTAGADIVGGEDLVKKIQTTKSIDVDLCLATPDMMPKLASIAKTLGQKGLMPNPKNETITTDVTKTITELRGGKVSFRSDDSGNLHQIVGRASNEDAALRENIDAFLNAIKKAKPADVKGTFLAGATLTSTMGPGIPVTV